MSDKLANATDAAKVSTLDSDIETLKNDVARLTKTLSTLLSDTASAAQIATQEGVERATAVADTAKQYTERKVEDLSSSVEQNPLTAVLIALGVGFALGAIGRSGR